MARVGALSRVAILDTSWLLEFYRVPGYFEESRTPQVRQQATELDKVECKLFVTVPVLSRSRTTSTTYGTAIVAAP